MIALSANCDMLNPHPSLSYWRQITKIWGALDWVIKKSDDFKRSRLTVKGYPKNLTFVSLNWKVDKVRVNFYPDHCNQGRNPEQTGWVWKIRNHL